MRNLPLLVACLTALTLTAPTVAATEPQADYQPAAISAVSDWRELGAESLEAPPASIAQEAPARGTVRVVTVTEDAGRPEVAVTEVASRDAAVDAIAAAQADPEVLAVEVDSEVSAVQIPTPPWTDPFREFQWALDRLTAEEAEVRLGGSSSVLVAVLDSGVQATITDLSGLVEPGIDYYVPSRQGRVDDYGHGTNVASIIAAHANNSVHIAGYNQSVRILPVKVLDAQGNGLGSVVTQGIIDATDAGAQVINLSLGGATYSAAQEMAVAYARSQGVVVIAAAGNDKLDGNPVFYPAAYPGVLAVGATASNDTIGAFSNTGPYLDLAAPGVGILVMGPDDLVYIGDGTSYAAPYVAGLAAQLQAANPALTPAQVDQLLTSTASDLGPVGRDDTFGHGLINPLGALCAVGVCATAPSAPTSPSATPGNGQIALTWAAPASTGGTPVRGYTVTRTPGGQTQNVGATATSATLTGLTNGTTYTLSIRAVNSVGASAAATAQATPRTVPGAPGNVTATAGDQQATVTWTPPTSTGGAALSGYTVTAAPGGQSVMVGPTMTSAAVAGLANGTTYTFEVRATNPAGQGPAATTNPVTPAPSTVPDAVTRLAGVDRYATAAAIAGELRAGGAVLYVASGQNFPDALSGAALAATRDAPVLLVRSNGIPATTAQALGELDPQRIVILGGPGSVNDAVADQLRAYATANTADEVTRLAGPDRYATAAAIAGQFPTGGQVLYVASGQNFPDALAGAALAGTRDAPVLLVRSNAIPAATAQALADLDPQRIVILGGAASVNDAVAQQLRTYATANTADEVTRLSGPDRYATAAAIAGEFPSGGAATYVASGQNFPDALAGAALAGSRAAPVVLVRGDSIPSPTGSALTLLQPQRIVILGGAGSVNEQVAGQLTSYVLP